MRRRTFDYGYYSHFEGVMMDFLDLYQVAEVQLVYRNKVKASQRPQISRSQDAYDIFMQTWDKDKLDFIEQAKLMLLNRNNRVLGLVELSTGGVSGTIVDPKIVLVAALKANASSIILAHNHPSGNPKPSQQDLRITQDIKDVSKRLTLSLHDHLILTSEGFYSMADELDI